METILAIIIVVDAYAIVYYRLLVKHYYEIECNTKESNLGAILSFPPYKKLPAKGKVYSKRYWIAIAVLLTCIVLLLPGRDFSFLKEGFKSESQTEISNTQ